jgi:hypothetical protein
VSLALSAATPAVAAKPKPEPVIASAARFGGYAVAFPAAVETAMGELAARRGELTALLDRFPADREAIKDPAALAIVAELVAAADLSGRSWAYVEEARQVDGVSGFLDTEGNDVSRKIAAANEAVATESSCTLDLYGSTSGALKTGSGKQQLERTRASNEAFFLIERYRGPLTRGDVTALMKLADDVARASYLVHIERVEEKVRLRRLAGEVDDVKRAADDVIAAETAWQATEGQTEAEKKASQARIEAARASRDKVDASGAVLAAEDLDGALDAKISGALSSYQAAFDALTP